MACNCADAQEPIRSCRRQLTAGLGAVMLRYAAASVGIVSRLAFVLKLEISRIRPPEFTSAMGNLLPTIWHLPNSRFTCRAVINKLLQHVPNEASKSKCTLQVSPREFLISHNALAELPSFPCCKLNRVSGTANAVEAGATPAPGWRLSGCQSPLARPPAACPAQHRPPGSLHDLFIHSFSQYTPSNPQMRCDAADFPWQPSSLPCLGISSAMGMKAMQSAGSP